MLGVSKQASPRYFTASAQICQVAGMADVWEHAEHGIYDRYVDA